MTLKEFALKYKFNVNELLELLKFEKFPISDVDEEIDPRIMPYLMNYSEKKSKKKFISRKLSSNDNLNSFKKNHYKKEIPKEYFFYLEKNTIKKHSEDANIPSAKIISYFIKTGKLYSINTVLTVEEIKDFAEKNEIKYLENRNKKTNIQLVEEQKEKIFKKNSKINKKLAIRAPVVVIVGHVDHGKTSLLDIIRKKAVAKSEKGGITQHIGAYEIEYKGKMICFIDTPGHIAFTELRKRGVSVADIGILIIASDDGVKEQTIESIKILKQIGIPFIVAFTKNDKENILSKEKLYQQLTERDIVPEEWGGNVPCISISSVNENGISELIETISLISEIADIKGSTSDPAEGYVIESKMIKGLGCSATIILQNGILNVSDEFYIYDIPGKVTSIINSQGKHVKTIGMSSPCIVSGLSGLCHPGEIFKVSDKKTIKEKTEENKINRINQKNNDYTDFLSGNIEKFKIINIIIKADVFSSLQAIQKEISNLIGKYFYYPKIIYSGIGNVSEKDILLAENTSAIIYAFSVGYDSNISHLMEQLKIKLESYDVIYHLIDSVKEKIEKKKELKEVSKKIGELLILKIFYIKSVGTVIGFKVVNGLVKNNMHVEIYREGIKMGTGKIISLQKERSFVKELTKGHEGAISIHGFNDFKEDDKLNIMEMQEVFE